MAMPAWQNMYVSIYIYIEKGLGFTTAGPESMLHHWELN